MNFKKVLDNIAIALAVGLIFLFVYKNNINPTGVHGPYMVRSIQVIQGNEFDITHDAGRIHGKLFFSTPPEAKVAVTRFLNESTNPKLYLISQASDFWYIRLVVSNDGKEVDLIDWLASKNLIWK